MPSVIVMTLCAGSGLGARDEPPEREVDWAGQLRKRKLRAPWQILYGLLRSQSRRLRFGAHGRPFFFAARLGHIVAFEALAFSVFVFTNSSRSRLDRSVSVRTHAHSCQ